MQGAFMNTDKIYITVVLCQSTSKKANYTHFKNNLIFQVKDLTEYMSVFIL